MRCTRGWTDTLGAPTAGAKNFDASNEEASTKVSRAVRALQDKLPLSRVIYASATGVSEIKNMAYAERLGLWGPGTQFTGFSVSLLAVAR